MRFGGIPLDKMPLLKTTFKIKTLNQRGVVRYLFFLLTHSVVASTSDSGSDNGGSSPPGSTKFLGMWWNGRHACLRSKSLTGCGFDSHHPHML